MAWRAFRQNSWFYQLIIFTFFAFSMQSCKLHPPFERPNVDVPATWRVATDEASSYANTQWWKLLQDPILDALIDESLANNNDLQVAIARVNQFIGQLEITRAGLYPQISGNLAFSRQENSVASPAALFFPRIFDIYTCLLNAAYDVDLWGEIRSATEASLAKLMASVEARRGVVLTLVAAVATTYIELRQFDLQLEISKNTYKSRVESFQLAEARYLGGLTSELEAKQAEAEMETAQIQVLQYEISVNEQENLLSILVGHPPEAIKRGLALNAMTMPPSVPAGIPSEVLLQRPDILEAEENFRAANAAIGVAYAQFFPSISLTGQFGNQSLQLSKLLTNPAETWQFAANLIQPIFTGGQLVGQLDVAEAIRRQAYFEYRQTVLRAFKEVNDALYAHQKALELIQVEKKRVDALSEALHLAILQYDNGQVDYLNVLVVERTLFDAQLSQAESMALSFISLINIYKSLGGGWVIDADNQALNDL